MEQIKYVIVTPVRDEGPHLQRTVEAVAAQTYRPAEWVIVNDGSTDHTGAVLDDAASRFAWIRAVHRSDRGFRKSGGGVVEAFNAGLQQMAIPDWDFLVKLDGDLSFEPDYFARCLGAFSEMPDLGIAGGLIYREVDGKRVLDAKYDPPFHVRGAVKMYRRACWDALGGLVELAGWDTLDEVKASMLGWGTKTLPDIPLLHHKPTGEADGGWKNAVKNGIGSYVCGYHPLFMLARCAKRLFYRPYVIHSIGLGFGYLSGYFRRVPRVDDAELVAYLRRQQLNCLLGRASLYREGPQAGALSEMGN